MVFERTVRGVTETRTIDAAACRSAEARRLASFSDGLKEVYDKPATLERKDKTQMIRGPLELLDVVMAEGENGLSLQRYKGLGEMNPDQLWETTLDPNARTLLQVKIDHMDEANEIFTTLMGDVVEPRRKFIQDNALSVENLDV
jgi:DNA gyrase subunit B